MKKFYHLLVTSYKLHVTSYKLQVERFKRFTSHLLPLTSHLKPHTSYLTPLTAYLFCFLPFSTFAQTPDPGCNCIKFDNLCWATCNVAEPGTFAASPTDTGWYYQWGVNVGWRPSPRTPLLNSNGGTTWDSTNPPSGSPPDPDEWINANAATPCPAGWRLPTQSEFADLVTTYLVPGSSTLDRLRSVNGRFFNSGDLTQPLLFLPAAGLRMYSSGELSQVGTLGYYWSSTQGNTTNAYCLGNFGTTMNPSANLIKAEGFSVRCVADL